MNERRYALIVASYEYEDEDIKRLSAPSRDAEDLACVLKDQNIGQFEVQKLINAPYQEIREAIAFFFAERKLDDLLLLYFSGHGMMDEDGRLYYVTTNTKSKILSATAISAEFVNNIMNKSHSRKQVLLLDCCHSGAAIRGMVAKSDQKIYTGQQFAGQGRVVLTASDSFQYAFESDEHSIFTNTLVYGLQSGEADLNRDGKVSIDELYNYIFEHVQDKTPNMTPVMWAQVKGRIDLALNQRIVPSELPQEILQAIASPFAEIRKASVVELERLSLGEHKGLSLAAQQALISLSKDDSQMVRDAASRTLKPHTTEIIITPTKRQHEFCPQCQQEINPKARFCFNCGESLGQECTSCGFKNTYAARFCAKCGQHIKQENLNS